MTITPHERERLAWYAWQWAEYLINEAQLELRLTAKCPNPSRVKYLHNLIRHQLTTMASANQMAKDCRTKRPADVDALMPVYDFEKVIAAPFGQLGECLERESSESTKARYIRSGLGPPPSGGREGYVLAENKHVNKGYYVRPADNFSFSPMEVFATPDEAWEAWDKTR